MTCGPISSWKDFSGNDKCGGVRAKVREEISQTNKGYEDSGWKRIKSETEETEYYH